MGKKKTDLELGMEGTHGNPGPWEVGGCYEFEASLSSGVRPYLRGVSGPELELKSDLTLQGIGSLRAGNKVLPTHS